METSLGLRILIWHFCYLHLQLRFLLVLFYCSSQLVLLLFAVRDVALALTLLIEFPAACVGSAPAPASQPAPLIVINAPRSIRKLELDATQPLESIHQTYQS